MGGGADVHVSSTAAVRLKWSCDTTVDMKTFMSWTG